MLAARIVELGKPILVQEVPRPEPGHGEVLIRIGAAGICHSDVHYRSGSAPPGQLPITPGHEIAGTVEALGAGVSGVETGDRVAVHYMKSCGACEYCARGNEQFCRQAVMIGKYCDGGYAEYIAVPARNAVPIPDSVAFEHAAVMMCSSATSLHALRKAGLQPMEGVAVFGVGGLGMSAVQLALALGAGEVFAVDINPARLGLAQDLGAVPIDARESDPVEELLRLTAGGGVDVALELVGAPETVESAIRCLGIQGRAALVGIGREPVGVDVYRDVIGKEAQIIGVSDHLLSEIPFLFDLAKRGRLRLDGVVTRRVPLEAEGINAVLDNLGSFGEGVRAVISPAL